MVVEIAAEKTDLGKYHYPNSAGGVGHGIRLVGMFDLPENRR